MKFGTRKISLILLILLVVGVLMLVAGGVTLAHYSSSEPSVTLESTTQETLATPPAFKITDSVIDPGEIGEPRELGDSKTTEPEPTTRCRCGCGGNSAISEPETDVPSCCGG